MENYNVSDEPVTEVAVDINDIKDTVKYSLKDIDKTKDDIDRSIDNGKAKVKVMEG